MNIKYDVMHTFFVIPIFFFFCYDTSYFLFFDFLFVCVVRSFVRVNVFFLFVLIIIALVDWLIDLCSGHFFHS